MLSLLIFLKVKESIKTLFLSIYKFIFIKLADEAGVKVELDKDYRIIKTNDGKKVCVTNELLEYYANELYANQINFPDEIDIWITIDGNNFNKKYMKVYLLGVFDNYSSTKEETIMRMQNIISEFTKFMGSYYQITSMQFDYANLDYAYQLNIDSKRKIIDVSKLHDSFKERDEILNSEFYIRWRKSIA